MDSSPFSIDYTKALGNSSAKIQTWALQFPTAIIDYEAFGASRGGNIIIIAFYSPSCLGQETAEEPFGLRVKLPPVYNTPWIFHTVPLIAGLQTGKLWIPIFIIFGLTRQGIEPESTISVADAVSTRPLVSWHRIWALRLRSVKIQPSNLSKITLKRPIVTKIQSISRKALAWVNQHLSLYPWVCAA